MLVRGSTRVSILDILYEEIQCFSFFSTFGNILKNSVESLNLKQCLYHQFAGMAKVVQYGLKNGHLHVYYIYFFTFVQGLRKTLDSMFDAKVPPMWKKVCFTFCNQHTRHIPSLLNACMYKFIYHNSSIISIFFGNI